jgi:hypothetical protein
MPGHLKGTEKKFEMCGISCHDNTKFLHATAEVSLEVTVLCWDSWCERLLSTITLWVRVLNYVLKMTSPVYEPS